MTVLDPFAPEARADTFPVYGALREQGPVHWSDSHEAFGAIAEGEIALGRPVWRFPA